MTLFRTQAARSPRHKPQTETDYRPKLRDVFERGWKTGQSPSLPTVADSPEILWILSQVSDGSCHIGSDSFFFRRMLMILRAFWGRRRLACSVVETSTEPGNAKARAVGALG